MKKALLLILMLYYSISYAQSHDEKSKADELMMQGKYTSAKAILDKLIKKDAKNDSLLTNRGICFYELHKIQDAYDDLTSAIAVNSKMAMAYLYRAKVFMSADEPHEAINDLNMAVRYAPDDSVKVWSLLVRSSAKLNVRQTEGGIEDSKAVLAIDSLNIGALNGLALALNQNGNHDEGLECLYKLWSIDSTLAFVPMNIGFIMISKNEFELAIEWINKAIKLDVKQPLTYNNRGYAKLKLGQVNEALIDINKSLSLYENNNYAYRNRALVYLEMKEIDKACADMQRSIDLGYTEEYGNEIKDLMHENCTKK